ncbi:MAG: hypothetical protein WAW37_00845 [Syntrophobacteraceae bacterium]
MRATIAIVFMLVLVARAGLAAEPAEIQLRDGSVIQAEIVSLENGVYTLRSDTLGTLRIEASRIRGITLGPRGRAGEGASRTPSALPDAAGQIKALSEAIMGDQDLMGKLTSLSADPDVRNALQDPEVMKAVLDGDVATLMLNEKFLRIMDKPAVREIIGKVTR